MRSPRIWTIILTAALALGGATSGCSRNKGKTVSVIGSTSIQPFAEMLAEEFNHANPGMYVEVQGGGSTAGLQAVESGYAHVGMCSRSLKSDESFTPITIALDGVAVIVHPSNPIRTLSIHQIREMFAGKVASWTSLGGPNLPVRLITREEGSGTREAFTNLVMEASPLCKQIKKLKGSYKDAATMPADAKAQIQDMEQRKDRIDMKAITQPSNGSVRALVMGDPAAIGYISLGQVGDGSEVRALHIEKDDGKIVEPTSHTVQDGRYPLVRPFLFVFKGELGPQAKAFIDFVLSDKGQALLEEQGLVRVPKAGANP